jgi:uncharacterized CHY-type Zn-finger protein
MTELINASVLCPICGCENSLKLELSEYNLYFKRVMECFSCERLFDAVAKEHQSIYFVAEDNYENSEEGE